MAIKDSTDKLAQLAHAASQSDADYALRRRKIRVHAAGVAAKATLSKQGIAYMDKAVRLKSVRLIPLQALTANTTEFFTVSVGYNDNAAGAFTALANITTKAAVDGGTGDWALGKSFTASDVTDDDTIAANKLLCYEINPGGGGTGIACNTSGFDLEIDVELL